MKRTNSAETENNAIITRAGKLLTAEEEIDLSKRILAGAAAKKALSRNGCLTEAERADLRRAAEDGEAAHEQLFTANIPLAKKIAYETWFNSPVSVNELEDYRQIAMLNLSEAARTFDWRYGCRFSTWAYKRISQAMLRENSRNGYLLRVPEDQLRRLSELKRLMETEGIDKAAKTLGMSREDADRLLLATNPGISLNAPVNADDPDIEFGDLFPDPCAMTIADIEEKIDLESDIRRLRAAMVLLPAAERELLEKRMGYHGEPMTLRELTGGIYGKTTGSVQKRQIKAESHLREIFNSLPLAG